MISSPLRYPGGKSKLFPLVSKITFDNSFYEHEYCEPYAGGAGLAIKLLTHGYVSKISLNDIDKSLYAMWKCCLTRTDEFCQLIETTPVTIEEWFKQRGIWASPDDADVLKYGFSAYFLNRTNRSGIIEGAGPIGGYDQKSKWKIDVRFVKDKQIDNIRCLSRFSDRVVFENKDASEFIENKIRQEKTFIYLDPPYYIKGKKLYKNFYEHKDHERIAKTLLSNKNTAWIVSYDDVPEIREMYRELDIFEYCLNYSAGTKSLGREIMYTSKTIKI